MYYFYHSVLLFCRHLIFTRQAQSSVEYIHSDIFYVAFDIGICPGSSVPIFGDEQIKPVYGLHMHRLPYGSAFCVDRCDGFKNFCRACHITGNHLLTFQCSMSYLRLTIQVKSCELHSQVEYCRTGRK